MEDYYCHDDYFDELDDGEDYCYDEDNEDNEDNEDDEGYIPPLARSIYFNDWKIYELVVRKNFYTAIASSNVLIADIDCGNNVKEHLKVLRKFVNANDACFYVYKTKNGMRYIQTDCMYTNVNRSAIEVLEFLGSDRKYIDFCRQDGRFMARVTPKLNSNVMEAYYHLAVLNQPRDCRTCSKIGIYKALTTIEIVDERVFSLCNRHDLLCNVEKVDLPLL